MGCIVPQLAFLHPSCALQVSIALRALVVQITHSFARLTDFVPGFLQRRYNVASCRPAVATGVQICVNRIRTVRGKHYYIQILIQDVPAHCPATLPLVGLLMLAANVQSSANQQPLRAHLERLTHLSANRNKVIANYVPWVIFLPPRVRRCACCAPLVDLATRQASPRRRVQGAAKAEAHACWVPPALSFTQPCIYHSHPLFLAILERIRPCYLRRVRSLTVPPLARLVLIFPIRWRII